MLQTSGALAEVVTGATVRAGRVAGLHDRCERVGRGLAAFGVFAMLAVALATSADIVLRWLALGSVPGLSEVFAYTLAVAVAATFPAGVMGRVNLAVDVAASRLSRTASGRLRTAGAFLLFLFFLVLAWCAGTSAAELGARGAVTMFLHLPEPPFIWAVAVLMGVCALFQLVVLVDLAGAGRNHGAVLAALAAMAMLALLAERAWPGLFGSVAATLVKAPLLTGAAATAIMMLMVFGMVPIAAAMGLVGLLGAAAFMGLAPAGSVLGSTAVEYLTSPSMAVLPLFLLMGGFCSAAGLSADIYRLAHVLFGHRRGGLAQATILGSAGFGAISSSSIATCAAIGQVVMPEMRARHYSLPFATGVIAAGGTLGPLLSPGSGPLVIYALLAEQSIGQLFLGSTLPALLAIVLFSLTAAILVRLRPELAPAPTRRASLRETGAAVARSWGVLLLFLVVFGGIYGGVFNVPEAAAVGAAVAFLFALARGKLSGGVVWKLMGEVTASTAMLYVMFFGALMFSYFIDYTGVPGEITTYLRGLPVSPWVVILLFLVVFVLLGCVMESYAVLLITVPLVAPYIDQLGFSPIWWGVLMVGVVETGMITPPLGLNVLVLRNYTGPDVTTGMIFRGVIPFIGADLVRLLILLLVPSLVTWLPRMLA